MCLYAIHIHVVIQQAVAGQDQQLGMQAAQ